MPDYTTLGISFPVPSDAVKLASLEAKLADDIRLTAITANQAIIAEGARAESAAKSAAAADASAKDAAIDAKATSAVSTANNALTVSSGASSDAENAVDRVTALESAAGFGPSTPTDGTMADYIANPASLTANQLSTAMGKKALSSGNQTASLQAFLNDAGVLGIRQVVGTFTISGPVTVPAKMYLDVTKATITQTLADSATFSAGAGSTIVGGKLVGLGSDYAPHTTGSLTIDSVGINVAGAGVTIIDTEFDNFARAAIFNPSHADLRVIRPRIKGVHLNGVTTIASGDAGCFGIYLMAGNNAVVEDLMVSHASIGMIAGSTVTDLRIRGVHAHTIPGQHGVYLQNGTGLDVSGVTGYDIALNLIKVQLQAVGTVQSYGTTISNISGRNVGDAVLSLNSTGTLSAASSRFNGLAVSNVTGHLCNRVAYIGNIRGGTVTGVSGVDTTNDVLTLVDVQDMGFEPVAGRGSGRSTVYITTLPGAATQRVTIGCRSHNAGSAGTAGSNIAIRIQCANDGIDGRDITLDGVDISADHGNLGAAVWFTGGHQESFRVRNLAITPGSTGESFRVVSASRMLGEFTNVDQGGAVPSIFPTGLPMRIGSVGYRTRWASNILPTAGAYSQGDHVDRSVVNSGEVPGWRCITGGGAYSTTRGNSTAYAVGAWIKATSTAHVYEVTTAGTTGAAEPTPPAVGATVTDGTAVLTLRATGAATFRALAAISAT